MRNSSAAPKMIDLLSRHNTSPGPSRAYIALQAHIPPKISKQKEDPNSATSTSSALEWMFCPALNFSTRLFFFLLYKVSLVANTRTFAPGCIFSGTTKTPLFLSSLSLCETNFRDPIGSADTWLKYNIFFLLLHLLYAVRRKVYDFR